MRMLIWHMERFLAEPNERGRSRIADDAPTTVEVGESLVVFAAVEKADEADTSQVAGRALEAVLDVVTQLGVHTVVLHSFSHLFVELAAPAVAHQVLNDLENLLEEQGCTVSQTAFGWFNRLEMRAKGHPLSRIARQV